MHWKNSRSWIWQPHYWFVVLFVLGAGFFHGANQLRIVGMALTLVALFRSFNRKTSLFAVGFPKELKFYLFWGVWTIVTGVMVADVQFLFWNNVKVLVQMMIMLWAGCSLMYFQRDTRPFLYAVLAGALINVIAVRMGYVSSGVGEAYIDADVDLEKTRATGITGNANSLGFLMLNGIWAVTMLWGLLGGKHRFLRLVGLIVALSTIVMFGYYTIYTGSRKSLLAVGLIVAVWALWIMPSGNAALVAAKRAIIGVILVVVGSVVVTYVLTETVGGARFQQLIDDGGGNAAVGFKESNIRYLMYVDGLKMWLHHPITGVGLGQFMVHFFSGQYSHSDYMEPLACTGLVGFILYQGFAVTILLRLIKMLRYHLADDDKRTVKGMILFLFVNHFFIGFGCPHWSGQLHEFIVMFCGAWSYRVSREYHRGGVCIV